MRFPRRRTSLSILKVRARNRFIHRIFVAFLILGAAPFSFLNADLTDRSSSTIHNSDLKQQDGRVKELIQAPVISDFDTWVKRHFEQGFSDKDQIEIGRTLSLKRRTLFKELIIRAPKVALDLAISSDSYERLPASISKNLERPFSAYADLLVHVIDDVHPNGEMRESRIQREVVIAGSRFEAFVYGRREAMTTKLNIPLHGIILDGVIAINESPARKLETSEYRSRNIELRKFTSGKIVAEIGGRLEYFSDQLGYEAHINDLIQWETRIGPLRPAEAQNIQVGAASWTTGAKKVLVIRVDFPDRQGEPVDSGTNLPFTEARALSVFSNEISPFFATNSYNKTSLQTTVTPVARLPQTQAHYAQNHSALHADARNAARGLGFETNNFDLDIITFSHSPLFPFAGFANVGAKGMLLNGFFSFQVFSHELGHNFGLNHANLWRTTDGSVIGPGNDRDGEDLFDRMGAHNDSRFHFNARYKRHLDWLTDTNVQDITADGVYRVFAHDSSTLSGIRVLKIKKDAVKSYWVEFRQLITDNPNVVNGATIRWDKPNSNQTQLLDMTPGTSSLQDAPLLVGQTFNDNQNHIRITISGKGNTTPESLDVKVELNVGCSFSLVPASQNFASNGGEGSIVINGQSGCNPVIKSTDDWISVVSTSSSSANYIVAANYGSQSRTGNISISGVSFSIQQSGAATACSVPPSGLVAWWRGEGNALDQTGMNNGSALSGMTYAGGKIGGAFRGVSSNSASSNKVLIPDSPSLALDRSLAVEGWLRFDSIANYIVLVRGDDRDHSGSYGISFFDGKLWFTVTAAPNGVSAAVTTPNQVPLNQFIHFAATLEDSTGEMKLYIDGGLVTQRVTTIRPYRDLDPAKNPRLAIGNLAHSNLVFDSFNGLIDELSIYNRALSAAEIQAIHSAGKGPTAAAGKCLSAATNAMRLVLESSSPPTRAIALDVALGVRDPFLVINPFNWLSRPQDQNTRLIIFLENFQSIKGEPASAVVVNIVGSNNQSFDVPAEDVRPLGGTPLTQVTFRLPDGLVSGTFTLKVTGHNETTNTGTLRISP